MKIILIVLLFSPVGIFAQKVNVFQLSTKAARHTRFANGWIALNSGWKFKAGDNPDWAAPGFNDSSWQQGDNLFNGVPVAFLHERIVWYRMRFGIDSTLENEQLAMRIYQTGASEVYLDGKLIHRLGLVSAHPDSASYYSPDGISLSFPITKNAIHTLAIRFADLASPYPIFSGKLYPRMEAWISTFDNAADDNFVRYYKTYNNRLNIAIGVAAILCILYLSFFIFFPARPINLYFALTNFFFLLFLAFFSANLNHHGAYHVVLDAIANICTGIYMLLMLYCIYRMFNQRLGWIFRVLLLTDIVAQVISLFVNIDIIGQSLVVLVLADAGRISIRSLRQNKSGAWILVIALIIDGIYWILNLLSGLAIIHILYIDTFVPLALLIAPLSLAIYLGYSFGMTSQSLQQKLTEVEKLSAEKNQILSNQNELLEQQVTERTAALHQSINDLRSTQAQLIQSEKMASLGELTAGIAHEIQNPLNFVNNFSEVSNELVDEMNDELNKGDIGEARAISADIKQNLEKINHHGKRADAIVKGMLQHSRINSGQKEPTDINKLADEYLRLAYHGLRAKDKSFNSILKTDYDTTIGTVSIIPQDIGRVILNLLTNAFYAVAEKKKSFADPGYEPTVMLSTKCLRLPSGLDGVEIKVIDNGGGIPQKIIDKIFQPFFTTKPTGQGTGLGLSLAYDIVKAHGGQIAATTTEGAGTEFSIRLPINST